MTAKEITSSILLDRYNRSLVIPRFTPDFWWEADIFERTAAGYFVEYEIKTTVADFKADFKKTKEFVKNGRTFSKNKHQQLQAGDVCGPSRFYFVTPTNLIKEADIPEYAGLYYSTGTRYRQIKKAPLLHKTKLSEEIVERIKEVCYYRYLNTQIK